MSIIPKNKPQKGLDYLSKIIKANQKKIGNDKIVLIGMRGYFLDTMGVKGKNDRRIYDDAAFWVDLSTGLVLQYNYNTDANGYRKGSGTGSKKGMANLRAGAWRYKTGKHKGYEAFVQAEAVTVERDGNPNYDDTGWFGINIHRGGSSGTSSLGCQTLPVAQWDDFKKNGYALLKKHAQKTFVYVLLDQQG